MWTCFPCMTWTANIVIRFQCFQTCFFSNKQQESYYYYYYYCNSRVFWTTIGPICKSRPRPMHRRVVASKVVHQAQGSLGTVCPAAKLPVLSSGEAQAGVMAAETPRSWSIVVITLNSEARLPEIKKTKHAREGMVEWLQRRWRTRTPAEDSWFSWDGCK